MSKGLNKAILLLFAVLLILMVIPSSFAADDSTIGSDSGDIIEIAQPSTSDALQTSDDNTLVNYEANTLSDSDNSLADSDDDSLANSENLTLGDGEENYIYVSTTGSDTTGTGTQDNPYGSLYKAINASIANDVIIMQEGYYLESISEGQSYTYTNYYTVSHNITIRGEGDVTLDLNKNTGFIYTSSSYYTTTVENIKIVNGTGSRGIYNYGGDVILNNVTFQSWNTTTSSGFIYTMHNVFINNSRFIDIAVSSGPILNLGTSSNSTVSNSVFINCSATYLFRHIYNPYATSNENGSCVANNNYWGTNDNPENLLANVTYDNWVILSIDGAEDCEVGDQLTIKAALSKVTDGIIVTDLETPLDYEFDISAVIGNLNQSTSSSANPATYTATAEGDETITVSANGLTLASESFSVSLVIPGAIYVNAATGSDDNDGSKDAPYASITKALEQNAALGGSKLLHSLSSKPFRKKT